RHPSPAVCGVSHLFFSEPATGRAWVYYFQAAGALPWLAGGTLCYPRTLWRQYPFAEVTRGEDTRFIWTVPRDSVLDLSDNSFYVATVHSRNTSPKYIDRNWRPILSERIRKILGPDWVRHQSRAKHGF